MTKLRVVKIVDLRRSVPVNEKRTNFCPRLQEHSQASARMAVLNAVMTKLLKFAKGTSGQDAVRAPTREENISRALGKVEPYVVWLQSILIWENPLQTIIAYVCFNVLFW